MTLFARLSLFMGMSCAPLVAAGGPSDPLGGGVSAPVAPVDGPAPPPDASLSESADVPLPFAARPMVPPPSAPLPPSVTVTALPSGGSVWVIPRRDAPMVRVELSLRLGYWDAPDPEALMMLGALMEAGTVDLDATRWGAAIDDLGAQVSLGVGGERAWVDVEAIRGTEEAALALARDALLHPRLSRRELRRIRDAWVRGADDAWRSGAKVRRAAMAASIYEADQPRGAVRTAADWRSVDVDRVRAAHAWLIAHAEPAVLVVGDVSAAEGDALAQRTWSSLVGQESGGAPVLPPDRGARVLLVDLPGSTQATISLVAGSPGRQSPDLPAARLAAWAVAGGFTSRLNLLLREQEGLTYGVQGTIDAWSGHGLFTTSTSVDAADVGVTLERMHGALWDLQRLPLSPEELAAARHSLWLDAARRADTLRGLAFPYGLALSQGRGPDAVSADLHALADVDVAAFGGAATGMLEGDLLWMIVGDRSALEPVLDFTGWTPDRVWSGAGVVEGRVRW